MAKYILLSGIAVSLIIRIFLIFESKHTADIYLMYNMGTAVLSGRNPYIDLDFNSYPPLAIFIEVTSLILSSILQLPFVFVFKFWPNLADFITAFLIYKILIRLKSRPLVAAFWSLVYLLNPVSIIISSAHGQIDSITSMFIILSVYFLTFFSAEKYFYLSAICLGIGIAVKPNPVMLIPPFLFYKKINKKRIIIFVFLLMLPLIITIIPFIRQNPLLVSSRILSYSGVNDFSYAAVLRGIWYQINAVTNIPLVPEFLAASKTVFITGGVLLTLIFAGTKNLAKACLTIYLLFLAVYFGIGSQYLIWVLPFAVITKDRMIFPYIVLAFLAQLGFYLFFGPDILMGKLSTIAPFQTKHIYLYFLGNLLLWLYISFWLIKLIKEHLSVYFLKFSTLRKNLIYATLISFILSFAPLFYLISEFFKRFTAN